MDQHCSYNYLFHYTTCFEQKESNVKWYGVMHNKENNTAIWHVYTRIVISPKIVWGGGVIVISPKIVVQ